MPRPDGAALAARLQELITLRQTTARTASVASGLSPDAIRNVCRGRAKSPRGETLAALARGLNISVEYLADPTLPLPDEPDVAASPVVVVRDAGGEPWGIPASALGGREPDAGSLIAHVVRREEELLPDYRAGDRVIVDTRNTVAGGTVLLRLPDGEVALARVRRRLSGPGLHVRIGDALEEEVDIKAAQVIGRAVGRWTALD